MKFLEDIKTRTLLIVPNDFKTKILKILDKENRLINIKIMTIKEFLEHYFYSYNEETIFYVMNKYKVRYSNAKMYLDNMKFVLELNLDNKKVKFLKEMYNDLLENKLLILDDLFLKYLETIDIKVLEINPLEKFYLNIFEKYNATIETLPKEEKIIPSIYHFKTIEEECNYVFNEISSLVNKGISLNNIKLINVSSEYIPFFKRMSKLYNIKIFGIEKNSIIATPIAKKIIEMIKTDTKKDIISKYLNTRHEDIALSIFNILNKYAFADNLKDVSELIIEDFKTTYIKEKHYQEEIEIIPLNSYLISEFDYVFLVGFNAENLPKTYKDIDYLSDNIKEKIGLSLTFEKNQMEKDLTLFHIQNIPNLVITYKDLDPYKSYYPSNLLEELGEIHETSSLNVTSNIYNKIKLTNELDLMLKYGEVANDVGLLLNTYYDIPYLTYNNKFQTFDFKIDNILLSYTSLNNYYHCSFRYYIENILKLNIYEDSFMIYIGNLFHFVLSKMFELDFDFEKVWNMYLLNREFTKKEEFYLVILKEELKKIIEIIGHQHELTGLNKVKVEEEINLAYGSDIFKGIIDKIMYQEKDNNTYIAVVDYKTGTPKTDMTNLIYGIDMQLPIYAYLIMKSNIFLNPKIIGFYFQQIITEKQSYDKKKTAPSVKYDKLKLNGYTLNDET